MREAEDPRAAFLDAAVWHGTLDRAAAILTAHPEVASSDIHTAAILGDAAAVRRFLELDPASATARRGPRGWDALTYLCFSKYLRLDPARSDGFVQAAAALLDAGADPNAGWYEMNHQPAPEWESVLYGAAGVAHHAGLTRLLLERGADPNDEETPYHSPETDDNGAVQALLDSGKLSADSLATMLLRKADWHDYAGSRLLLEAGADPNRMTRWHHTALHQAVRRDNALANIELLLDHGADATLANRADGRSAVAIAARRGRGDVLALLEQRGVAVDLLEGVDRLIAACARNDAAAVQSIARQEPSLVRGLIAEGGRLLGEFAGNGNNDGIRRLMELGVEVGALFKEGDGYWDVAADSTALHVAAWRAQHATVRLLLERGASVNQPDGRGRTPLALAVRACVDSYWMWRRSPESVAALLAAGASRHGIVVPSGYGEIDDLLRRHPAS